MYQVLVTTTDGNTFAANVSEDQYGFITSHYLANISVEIYSNKAINESHGKYGKFKTYKELIRWLSCAKNKEEIKKFEELMAAGFADYIHIEKSLRTCKYILTYEYNSSGELLDSLFEKIKRDLIAYIRGLKATTRDKCRQCVRLAMRDYIHTH